MFEPIKVYTTRQDTVFGATFMCLAPEHPLVTVLAAGTPQEEDVQTFVARIALQDRSDRGLEQYEKEGVFTGAYCINPMNGRRMPVYTANFALMEYGTGAVMSVPATAMASETGIAPSRWAASGPISDCDPIESASIVLDSWRDGR